MDRNLSIGTVARALVAGGLLALAGGTVAQAQPAKPAQPTGQGQPVVARNSESGTPAGTPVARLEGMEGNVLVSGDTGLGSGEESMRIVEGSRIITTANSKVEVVFDDGCRVKLKADERIEIDMDQPCKARAAMAASILATPAGMMAAGGAAGLTGSAAAATLASGLGGGILTGVAGLATAASLGNLASQRDSVSPN